MVEIKNFKYTAQIGSNGCYGAVAKMIIDCRGYNLKNENCKNILNQAIASEEQGNPIVLMDQIVNDKICDETDDKVIPTMDEIAKEINLNKPFICCLGETPGLDREWQDGHWIIIMGYDCTTTPAKIKIADPDRSQQFIEVEYCGDNTMHNGMYFKNTTYVD